jgi:hypothetical protein
MGMNFQKRVADEVAKAGFRQKPGPKKGSIKKHVPKISRCGKTNHSDWNAQEISVENPTSEMAPPWSSRKTIKIVYQRQCSCKSQAASAIRFVIAHS